MSWPTRSSNGGSWCRSRTAQVGRYLREAELQPHKSQYWLNTTEKDPVRFQEQVNGGL